ncbi:MAG TPA: AraC family transcriptional regulator [Cyclobacteriaceae bacterium]|nr:AraC family transcriptional regulator [Cyclobacteriaceae bacterium]
MKEGILLGYGIFAGHSLLLAILLFLRHRNSGNKLLGVILLLLTARVGKSIISLAWPQWALPVNVLGLAAMAALGPFLLFYVGSLYTKSKGKLWIHLIPAVMCLGAWSWILINVGYIIITAQLLAYVGYTCMFAFRNSEIYAVDNIRWRWTKGVVLGMMAISISFTIQMIFYNPIIYLANVGVSVAVLYVLSLWALRQNKLFTDSSRKNTEPETETYARLGEKVKKLMDEEMYIDSDLNLTMMARNLDVQPYLLSKAINACFGMTFPEMILEYRLRKAEQLLISSLGKVYTVEAIAYESGFNTLSVFYQAFKKKNGITPTQFKKKMEEQSTKFVARLGGSVG